ncbi:OmpA family protein [Candidatus Uabimicrobium amorphum]|uniref:MotB n=1 Tax=Uabimicrobium amorphum TaxID=2596890 RepID=A0A5S9F3R5_UABAM|nr:OmpA family protein [Candidatus Uabimicrobium amorphum]BBM85025.1 MotB [Candidatus Uabimicrobium amorphum]
MAKNKSFEKVPVPAYMTSFADMMTIVLTFFILLYSYADKRQLGVVKERIDAFNVAIDSMGLPGITTSGDKPVNLSSEKPKFPPFPGKQNEEEEENKELSPLPTITGTRIKQFERGFSTKIFLPKFAKKSAVLTKQQKNILQSLVKKMQTKEMINIIGYSHQEYSSPEENLKLAFRRALAITKYLYKYDIKMEQMRPMAKTGLSSDKQMVEISFEEF